MKISLNHFTIEWSYEINKLLSSDELFEINQEGSVFIEGNVQSLKMIVDEVVGGEIIPIESTSLLLAGAQSFSWMIPVVLSVLGIGLFVVSRKSE